MTDPIFADFHVHTHLSPCGKPEATAFAMIERARAKRLAAIGFADHITPHPVVGCAFYERQRLDILDELRAEIDHMAGPSEPEILVGMEADYTLAGPACLDPDSPAQPDYIVCAASHFHLPAAPQPAGDTPRAKAALMHRMAHEALSLSGVSIWAHPFACSYMRPLVPIMATISQDEMAELIALANEQEIAIEINGGPARQADYRQAMTRFFELAHAMGARFTVTADAHHPDDLERLDLALSWARQMGLSDEDLLTARELRDLQRSRVI
jgi:histidinol phosphatase-like PHP family hydrolase